MYRDLNTPFAYWRLLGLAVAAVAFGVYDLVRAMPIAAGVPMTAKLLFAREGWDVAHLVRSIWSVTAGSVLYGMATVIRLLTLAVRDRSYS